LGRAGEKLKFGVVFGALEDVLGGNGLLVVGKLDGTNGFKKKLDSVEVKGNDTVGGLMEFFFQKPLKALGGSGKVGVPVGVAEIPAALSEILGDRFGRINVAFELAVGGVDVFDVEVQKVAFFKGNQSERTDKATGGAKFKVVLKDDKVAAFVVEGEELRKKPKEIVGQLGLLASLRKGRGKQLKVGAKERGGRRGLVVGKGLKKSQLGKKGAGLFLKRRKGSGSVLVAGVQSVSYKSVGLTKKPVTLLAQKGKPRAKVGVGFQLLEGRSEVEETKGEEKEMEGALSGGKLAVGFLKVGKRVLVGSLKEKTIGGFKSASALIRVDGGGKKGGDEEKKEKKQGKEKGGKTRRKEREKGKLRFEGGQFFEARFFKKTAARF